MSGVSAERGKREGMIEKEGSGTSPRRNRFNRSIDPSVPVEEKEEETSATHDASKQ